MSNLAVVALTGNLGKDAELMTTASDKTVIKFSLAVKTGYKDSERLTWWNCSYWTKNTAVMQFLLKGKPVAISGEPSLREYSTDSGKRQSLDVNVSNITLLGSKEAAAPADDANDDGPPLF